MNHEDLLADLENARPLPSLADGDGMEPIMLAIGPGAKGLEVAVAMFGV